MDSIYPGFESDNWFGLFVPTGTSKEIVARLHSLALEALKTPEMRDIIAKDGGDVVGKHAGRTRVAPAQRGDALRESDQGSEHNGRVRDSPVARTFAPKQAPRKLATYDGLCY